MVDAESIDERDFPLSELRGGYVAQPGAVRATIADDALDLLVTLDAVVRGGDLVAESVTVRKLREPQAPSLLVTEPALPGVTGTDLRHVPVASYLAFLLSSPEIFTVAEGDLTSGASGRSGPVQNPNAARAQTRRDGDERLSEVVDMYRRLLGDPRQRHRAATATAEALHISRAYVMRLLKQARTDSRYAHLFPEPPTEPNAKSPVGNE